MYVVTNHRASRIKLKNGKFLGRGQSVIVDSKVIADADLVRLAARGKVSISKKVDTKDFVKYGVENEVKKPVVDKAQVKKPVVEKPKVEKPEVKNLESKVAVEAKSEGKTAPKKSVSKPKADTAVEKVDEEPKKPTVKRRGRRKSAES